jgi:hypothetical protein
VLAAVVQVILVRLAAVNMEAAAAERFPELRLPVFLREQQHI